MKKIKYLLALAALLLCVPALAAETPRLKIEVPGQNAKPQEEFAVTLSLHDIPSIAALGFHISYDKTRLELLECEMAPEGFNLYINKENGKAVFVGAADYIEDGHTLKPPVQGAGKRRGWPCGDHPCGAGGLQCQRE